MQQDMREQTEASREKAAEKKRPLWLRYLPKVILGLGVLAVYFSWHDYHRKPSQKELDIALTRYMRGKYAIYGDTLTPKGEGSVMYLASDIFYSTSNTYELAFTSEKYPKKEEKEEIVLDYDYEKNTLRDNYMSFVLRNQAEEKFREIFDRIYEPGTYELAVAISIAPYNGREQNATEIITEYLKMIPWNYVNVCVIREPEKRENDMQCLLDVLKEYGYDMNGRIYYVTQQQFDSEKRKEEWIGPREFPRQLSVNVCWNRGDDSYYIYSWEESGKK